MRIETKYNVMDLVPFGKGYALPRRFDPAVFKGPELTHVIEMVVTLDAGRFVCESVRVRRKKGGPPVTGKGLRDVPVATLLRTMAISELLREKSTKAADGSVKRARAEIPDLRALASQGPTDEVMEYVALVYRIAFACGEGPTGAVRDAFGVPRATAARWVTRARADGHLGPTEERRAGEVLIRVGQATEIDTAQAITPLKKSRRGT